MDQRLRLREWSNHQIHAELVSIDVPTSLVGHTHDAPHALVVLEGVLSDDGRSYTAGDVRLSRAGDPHFVRMRAASTCLVIVARATGALPIVTERWSGRLSQGAIVGVARAYAHGDLDMVVAGAMQAVHGAPALDAGGPSWLEELRRTIAVRGQVAPGITWLARRAGVSREHLSRSFQRHYGTSFVTFRRHQRVARACRMMSNAAADWPLAAIASACGFADQSHMTRAFRRCLGTTPGGFRRSAGIIARDESQMFKTTPSRFDNVLA